MAMRTPPVVSAQETEKRLRDIVAGKRQAGPLIANGAARKGPAGQKQRQTMLVFTVRCRAPSWSVRKPWGDAARCCRVGKTRNRADVKARLPSLLCLQCVRNMLATCCD